MRATCCHNPSKTAVEPVKCRPAKSAERSTAAETAAESPGTKLMTPGGKPAASSSSRIR
ncbi:Uncharacterised protein [Bordetella pertussis]|nr:Uncharacterised protein [Bordetella pertussis]